MSTYKKLLRLLAWSLAGCALFISHTNSGQVRGERDRDLFARVETATLLESRIRDLVKEGLETLSYFKDAEAKSMKQKLQQLLNDELPASEIDSISHYQIRDDAKSLSSVEEKLKRLLDSGVDPNQTDWMSWTPLGRATHSGAERLVGLLLHAGADPDLVADGHYTPLWWAARLGYEGIVKKLLTAGADPNLASSDELTALQEAAIGGYEGIVETLLQAGAQIGDWCGGLPEPGQVLIKQYEPLVQERQQAVAEFLNEQANQQTSYSTGGHGFPAALKGLVEQFEGTQTSKKMR